MQKSVNISRLGKSYELVLYRIRVLAVPPRKKMGGTHLKIFNAPKNFCDFHPVHEKTRLKLAHFFEGGVQKVHEYGKLAANFCRTMFL